jgi:hypothetical protein
MQPIQFSEVKNIYEYEKIRPDFRAKIIAEKKHRRFQIGEHMTIVFENRNSVLFQIQEMIRVEKIITDEGMQHEIDTYNVLLPAHNELSATLLIDITEKHLIKPMLDSLIGLHRDSIYIIIDGREIPALFDESQIEDDRISAVQYIKWVLTDEDVRKFSDHSIVIQIAVKHKNYTASHTLTEDEQEALSADLIATN